jgi:hypothetical protein
VQGRPGRKTHKGNEVIYPPIPCSQRTQNWHQKEVQMQNIMRMHAQTQCLHMQEHCRWVHGSE